MLQNLSQQEISEVIRLLREAIELAGDGGPQPFTEEEYSRMYNFLNELEKLFIKY